MFKDIKKAAVSAANSAASTAVAAKNEATGKNEIDKLQDKLKKRNDTIAAMQQELKQTQLQLEKERSLRAEAETSLKVLQDEIEEMKISQDTAKKAEIEAQEKAAQAEAAAAMAKTAHSEAVKNKALKSAGVAYNAFGTLSTNDESLAIAICEGNNVDDVQVVVQTYMCQFGKNLRSLVTKKTSGHFRTFLLGRMRSRFDYAANECFESFGSVSTNEGCLISQIMMLNNEEIVQLKDTFKKNHNKDLEGKCSKETSGHLKSAFNIVLQGMREDNNAAVDNARVTADAKSLFDAGQGKTIGTDEIVFVNIICNRSAKHLTALNEAYKSANPKKISLIEEVDKQLSGSLKDAMLTVLTANISRPQYFADMLQCAMEGIGFNEGLLIRTVLNGIAIPKEWPAVIECYNKSYGKEKMLIPRLIAETSGLTGPSAFTFAVVHSAVAVGGNPSDIPDKWPTLDKLSHKK